MKRNLILFLLLLLIMPALTLSSYIFYQNYKKKTIERAILLKRKLLWEELKRKIEEEILNFKGEVGIVIKDFKTSWQISFNKDKEFISASLVKVPIMIACFLAEEQNKLSLEEKIKLKSRDKIGGAGILKFYPPNTELSLEKLIGLMIYESDNTATNLLIDRLGMDYLNRIFKEIGLKNTNLTRKVADYKARREGLENYTTPQDLAMLLEKLYYKELLSKENCVKALMFLKLQRIKDRIPKYINSEVMVAHKTGLERGVCHDAGIVFSKKGDYLIVVLTHHKYNTAHTAKEFIAKVGLYVYNYFKSVYD